jgi:hypothetical protein
LVDRRREKLKELKRQISRYQDVLADAMSKDFGFRAPAESKMLDLLGSMLEANHAIAHLKRWMKPSRRATDGAHECPGSFRGAVGECEVRVLISLADKFPQAP